MKNLLKKASIKQKYIMFCIMLLAIISIIEFFVAFASSANNTSTSFVPYDTNKYSFLGSSEHDGTEQDPYIIANEDEFYQFCNCVNEGNNFEGRHVKLISDIDVGYSRQLTIDYTGTYGNFAYNSTGGVEPIGNTSEHAFKGTFDGGDHYIYNFNLNTTDLYTNKFAFRFCRYDDSECYFYHGPYDKDNPYSEKETYGPYAGGLFGYIDGAKIKNVYLANTPVEVVVDNAKSKSMFEEELKLEEMTMEYVIERLVQTALRQDIAGVSGTYSGGIVGKATGDIKIENCKNYGVSVIGTRFEATGSVFHYSEFSDDEQEIFDNTFYSCAGGIVGDASKASGKIIGCLNFAKVRGDCAGGIVGRANNEIEIQECFNYSNEKDTYKVFDIDYDVLYENYCIYEYIDLVDEEGYSKYQNLDEYDGSYYSYIDWEDPCRDYGFIADISGICVGGICGYGGKSYTDCGNIAEVKNYGTQGILTDYVFFNIDADEQNKTYRVGPYYFCYETNKNEKASQCILNTLYLNVFVIGSGGIVGNSSAMLTRCYSTKISDAGAKLSFSVNYDITVLSYSNLFKNNGSNYHPLIEFTIQTANTGLGGGFFDNCCFEDSSKKIERPENKYFERAIEIDNSKYVFFSYNFNYYASDNKMLFCFEYGFEYTNGETGEAKKVIDEVWDDPYKVPFSINNAPSGLSRVYTSELKKINLGSNWARSASINDGYPHLKRFYWEDNAGLDGAGFGG